MKRREGSEVEGMSGRAAGVHGDARACCNGHAKTCSGNPRGVLGHPMLERTHGCGVLAASWGAVPVPCSWGVGDKRACAGMSRDNRAGVHGRAGGSLGRAGGNAGAC